MSLVTIAAPRDGPIVALQTPIDCPVVLSTRRLLIVEIAVSSQVPGVVGNRSSAASRRLPETIATAPIPAARAARYLCMGRLPKRLARRTERSHRRERCFSPWRRCVHPPRRRPTRTEARDRQALQALPPRDGRASFDWALSQTPRGEALSRLASRYSESLFFAPPEETAIRHILPRGSPAAIDAVLDELRRRRDAEFNLMIAEHWGQSKVVDRRETLELAA